MCFDYLPCGRQVPIEGVQPIYPVSPTAPLFPLPPIGTQLPTGMPAGQPILPMPMPGMGAGTGAQPIVTEVAPESVQNVNFTPGFLRTQIGKRVRIEFLIGTNGPLVDRTGTLLAVGASYVLIQLTDTDDIQMCDIYSIKFVTVFY